MYSAQTKTMLRYWSS